MKNLRFVNEPEATSANDNPGEKFPEDGGLAEAHHPFARDFRGEPHDRKTD